MEKRPLFLSVISILSIISISFGLLNAIFLLLVGKIDTEQLQQAQEQNLKVFESLMSSNDANVSELMNQLNVMQMGINENVYLYGVVILLAYFLGLYGVLLMRKGFKRGFHFYIVYNLIILSSIYLCVSVSDVPMIYVLTNALFSSLFIMFYALNRKWFIN